MLLVRCSGKWYKITCHMSTYVKRWQTRTCWDDQLVTNNLVHHRAFYLYSSLMQGWSLEIVDHSAHTASLVEIIHCEMGCTVLSHLHFRDIGSCLRVSYDAAVFSRGFTTDVYAMDFESRGSRKGCHVERLRCY